MRNRDQWHLPTEYQVVFWDQVALPLDVDWINGMAQMKEMRIISNIDINNYVMKNVYLDERAMATATVTATATMHMVKECNDFWCE